jgi:hypothetical protein
MTRRMQLLAPAGTFVAVVATGVAVALVSAGGPSDGPRVLNLAGSAGTDAALAPSPSGGEGSYRLTGTLPQGAPPDAPAWTLRDGSADAGLVRRLAKALHAGTPAREGDSWRADGLVVTPEAGQSWYWSPCGPDTAVSSDGTTASCTAAGSAGSNGSSGAAGAPVDTPAEPAPGPAGTAKPVPEQPSVSPAVVREGSRAVFDALGLDVDRATVTTSPDGGSAVLSPEVGGVGTVGVTTRVDVGRDGTPQGAGGWLATARRADTYPLVSAQEAFDALPASFRTLACPVTPDGKGCPAALLHEITGAHLGLSLQPLLDGSQILVPSWLFDVRGSDEPVAGVAVSGRYLRTGHPGTADPATGAPEPGAAIEPAPAQQGVPLLGASRSADATAVAVTYDNGGCGRRNLTHAVKESPDSVVVLLQADPPPPDQMCTADSRPAALVVQLEAPLAERAVVDGSTGRTVPLS